MELLIPIFKRVVVAAFMLTGLGASAQEEAPIASLIKNLEASCRRGIDRAPVTYEDELSMGAFYDTNFGRFPVEMVFSNVNFGLFGGVTMQYYIQGIYWYRTRPKYTGSYIFYAPLTPFVALVAFPQPRTDGTPGIMRGGNGTFSLSTANGIHDVIKLQFATEASHGGRRQRPDPIIGEVVTATFSSPVTGQSPYIKLSDPSSGMMNLNCVNLTEVNVYAETPSGLHYDGPVNLVPYYLNPTEPLPVILD